MLSTAVVVLGGDPVDPGVLEELPAARWVVAADSGIDHAARIGLDVDVLIGDMDSVSDHALATHDGPLERHPADKDATDFELALGLVAERPNIDRVIVVGGHGGRLDHLLANASVLASDRYSTLSMEWIAGDTRVHVVRDHCELHGVPGDTVSLLAIGGDAIGVTTRGLRWPLSGARLAAGEARGISNELSSPVATVSITGGRLLAILPGDSRPQPEPR